MVVLVRIGWYSAAVVRAEGGFIIKPLPSHKQEAVVELASSNN